jgi:hypothetical protein
LKPIGGSLSDSWNNVLVNQVVQTLWPNNSDEETRDRHAEQPSRVDRYPPPRETSDEMGEQTDCGISPLHKPVFVTSIRLVIPCR